MRDSTIEASSLQGTLEVAKRLLRDPMILCAGNRNISPDSFGPRVYDLLRRTHLREKVELLRPFSAVSEMLIRCLEQNHDLIVVDAASDADVYCLGKIEPLWGSYPNPNLYSRPFGKLWIVLTTITEKVYSHLRAGLPIAECPREEILTEREIDASARTVASVLAQVFHPGE